MSTADVKQAAPDFTKRQRRRRRRTGKFDRIVGPGDLLRALHLLRQLGHSAPELVRVAEEPAEWIF